MSSPSSETATRGPLRRQVVLEDVLEPLAVAPAQHVAVAEDRRRRASPRTKGKRGERFRVLEQGVLDLAATIDTDAIPKPGVLRRDGHANAAEPSRVKSPRSSSPVSPD